MRLALFGLTLALGSSTAIAAETGGASGGTPFDPSRADGVVMARLGRGAIVRRSLKARTLTREDRTALENLGFRRLNAGAVVIRRVPTGARPLQIARLRELARAVEGFAPSGVCDNLAFLRLGVASCSGRVDGPLGSAPVRMAIGGRLDERPEGGLTLTLQNVEPLEVKGLFSWSAVAKPNGLKLVVDLVPTEDDWLVYSRVGVAMDAHTDSAEKVADVMLRLEAWLADDLARR